MVIHQTTVVFSPMGSEPLKDEQPTYAPNAPFEYGMLYFTYYKAETADLHLDLTSINLFTNKYLQCYK